MKKKRILSVLLSLAMVVSLMPAVTLTSSAADSEATPFYVGNAMRYADTDDVLSAGYLTSQLDNITMEAWVKADTQSTASTNIRIMYNGNSAHTGYGIYLVGASKSPCVLMGNVGFLGILGTTVTLNNSQWYHLAAVRDNGVWRFYVNDTKYSLTSNTLAPNALAPGDTFTVGNSTVANENFTGSIDEVRFWTVARTEEQIKANMYVKLNGTEDGLLAYYNFDQNGVNPGGDNTGITTVTDAAGEAQNLTISGFALTGDTSNFVQSVRLGTFQLENNAYSVNETAGSVAIPIVRTDGSEGSVTINYATADDTATAGTNYTATSGSVTFAEGETQKFVQIPVINQSISDSKAFTFSISGQSGVSIGTNSAAVTITPGYELAEPVHVTTAEELSAAFASGGYFVLDNDIAISSPLTVPSGKTVILDLKGHTIDRGLTAGVAAANGRVIAVNGSLTIIDSATGGKITGGNTTSTGGGIDVAAGGSLAVNGGSVSGNTAAGGGGGVCVDNGGSFTMSAGEISGNQTVGNGGGVYANEGLFIMNGGTISGNTAEGNEIGKGYGGGVAVMYGGTFTMKAGVISSNTAKGYSTMYGEGGGVYVNMSGSFTMDGGEISENEAYYGGGVYLQGSAYNSGAISSFTMSAGEISNNITDSSSASGYGGGVYVASGTFNLSGDSKIIKNSAAAGGGVYVLNGTCAMENSEISENTTFEALSCDGGGIYLANGNFTMNSGNILKNEAACGGGLFCLGGTFTMKAGQINENMTYALDGMCDGGGVYLDTGGTFSMEGGEIRGNATSAWNMYNHGGGVYVYGGTLKVSGAISIIDNNRSGVPNNVYLKTDASIIKVAGVLTGDDSAIGISTRTASEGTTSLTVAQGANYTIVADDFNKFTRDTCGTLSLGENKIDLTDPNTSYLKFLSYNANGGSGSHSSSAIVEGNDNNIAVASVNDFSRVNCSFAGWNTKADGSGTAYQPGETLKLTADTVLYAQWTIDKTELTITAPNGGAAPNASAACSPTGVTAAITWKKGESALAGTDSFDYNTVYSVEMTLTAGSGCKFADSPAVTVNGESATVISNNGTALAASFTFDKTGPRSAPTAALSQSTIDIENAGGSQTLTLNVADIIEGYNSVTWSMSETDGSNILTLPSTTTGTLSSGSLSLGDFVVASNSAGQPAKSASVTISFGGNENGEYAGVPASVTVTFQLAAGDAPEAVLDFSNEKITGVTSQMEYIINDSGSTPGDWTGAIEITGAEILLSGIVPDAGAADKYIHIRFKGLNGVPKTLKIRVRPSLADILGDSWDSWVTYNIENETELGYVPADFGYRIKSGTDKINDTGGDLSVSLAPGDTLTFWQPAAPSSFKSDEITITAPSRLEEPLVGIDFENKKLNTAASMQYRLGTEDDWTDCAVNMVVTDFGWDGTSAVSVQLRYPNTAEHYASDAQMLTIPACPDSPAISYTATTSTITVTAETGVRYRLDGGEWKTADENGKIAFSGLAANQSYTIEAQKTATQSAFQSEASQSISTSALADGTGSVSMASWTYGDTAQNPVPVSATNGTSSVSYSYSGTKADGTVYNSSTRPTDAGSYTVTAAFAATSEYKQVISEAAGFTIAKKEIEVQWKNLNVVYDGMPKSPSFTLLGVESGDIGGVSAKLSESKTNAGSYSVAATLNGSSALNYNLVNPNGMLVIQKAPVTFSITGDTAQYDGGNHTAIVAAASNGSAFSDFSVTYINNSGDTEANPSGKGSYGIYVQITDANYRHADAADGSAEKIGVLTIYTVSSPNTYTLSFSGGDGAVGSVKPLATAQAGTVRFLPDSTGMTNGTKFFAGWEYCGNIYQPGESLPQPACNITLTATWTEDTYSVSGVVYQGETPLPNAVVTLMRGSVQVGLTVSGADGEYDFEDAAPGLYNLVASKRGVMQTVLVEIVQSDATNQDIILPSWKTNSVVEIDAGSPAIVVGKLEQTFSDADKQAAGDGSTVEMKLIARALESSGADQAAIDAATDDALGLYLKLNLTKTVTPTSGNPSITVVTESGVLLDIAVQIPGELQGKDNYVVLRRHNGETQTLTKAPNSDGECITVNADKTVITIHAKLFSTYAVGYIAPADLGDTGNNSSSGDYTITAVAGNGGSISPSGSVSAPLGSSKTFTVTPDNGYAISDVLVDGISVGAVSSYIFSKITAPHSIKAMFAKTTELPYYLGADGNKVFIGFCYEVNGTIKYVAPKGKTILFGQNLKNYTDTADHWAKSGIDFVTQRDIFQGTGIAMFSPNIGMTRAMFATVIGRLYERSYGEIADVASDGTFTDVDYYGWYGKYAGWAADNGLINGIGDGLFASDREITRQEMAAILYRFADFLGVLPDDMDTELNYADAGTISGWAQNAALYCQSTGIITGRDGGIFAAETTATRAEAAVILQRFVETV